WRDVGGALIVVVTNVFLAYFVGPPKLNNPPHPSLPAPDPRPHWYMLWYFAVLAPLPRGGESAFMVVGPPSPVIFLLLVPVIWNKGDTSPSAAALGCCYGDHSRSDHYRILDHRLALALVSRF